MMNWKVWLALLFVAVGCRREKGDRTGMASTEDLGRLYARQEVHYETGVFFKPGPQLDGSHPTELFPLIIQQAQPGQVTPELGVLGSADADRWEVDTGRPVIYAGRSDASIRGQIHEQLVYVWVYASGTVANRERESLVQGLRMTVNDAGYPIVWEVLGDPFPHMIFVSAELEAAAAAEFGQPLPGRRFSIERDFAERRDVAVVRSLADAPVPMGPFVYLQAATGDVDTIICRCMASQVDDLFETVEYDLRPLEELWVKPISDRSPLRSVYRAVVEGPRAQPTWLENALRIPAGSPE